MKRCDIEIWKHMLDAKGPVYAESLCCNLGMTRRQLLSRISGLDQEIIIRSGDPKNVYFTLNATPQQLVDATAGILASFFKCDRARVMSVVECISIAGYMTLDEVETITHVPPREAAYILYVMPNVVMQKGSKKNHYRRFEHVPVDMGTANIST